MAARAATAVKSKAKSQTKSKSPAAAKPATVRVKTAKKAAVAEAEKATVKATAVKPAAAVKAATVPAKPRRRTKVETRTRIYWAVFNENLKRVAVFEFDQKAEAEKRASRLMTSSGDHHFIQKIKAAVPA